MGDKSSTPPVVAPIETNCQPVSSSHLDEKDAECFTLPLEEEPLGVGSKSGFGHYDAQFGEVIGPADGGTTYRIERKLGWGLYSSVWLARELQKDRFVALKILTTNATHLHHKTVFIEVDALALLAGHPNIIRPLRDFTIPATQSSDLEEEEHIVIATALCNGTLKKILTASPSPPLPFVRRAMLHVLRGLAHMHSRGFVHTDLKADNILVDCGPITNVDIDAMLAADPPRRCSPKANSLYPAAVSQSLPVPTVDDAMTRTFCISDMGAACLKDYLKAGMKLSPEDLQAPEIILGAPLDEKVDIWLFGLLMLETVTGKTLFHYARLTNASESDVSTAFILWQMCALLSDVDAFPLYLRGGIYAAKYLDADGVLFEPDLPPQAHSTLHFMMAKRRPDLDSGERDAILAIALRCLQLDPQARPSAAELLEDPWWGDA